MALSVSVSIDVPSLALGAKFYSDAFGFTKVAEPVPGVLVMRAGESEICLLEKAAGSPPAPGATDMRRYERHWTPVHMDVHVEDFAATLARALAAGAVQEQLYPAGAKHGAVAFCSDPFGHGFCLIERRARG
jgi:predicted enzyme related to lactoylglutathione lyase